MIEKSIPLSQLSPSLEQVYSLWRRLGGERLACSWQDFPLEALPPAIIPTTLVVDVKTNMADNVFRFWGSGMTNIHGGDFTGRTTAELRPVDLADSIMGRHAETVNTRSASASIFGFERHGGYAHIQELLRLPLSDDGESVTHIVVAIDLNEDDRLGGGRQLGEAC